MTLIQRLIPLNLESEKKKFFFDPNYNPQFVYKDKITSEELQKYVTVSNEYLSVADKIIELAAVSAKTQENDELQKKNPYLPKDEVERIVNEYVESEGLRKVMSIRFTDQTLARTSVYQNTLIIHLPVEYTHSSLIAMLHHEIGTHQLRSMNDRKQVWRGKTQDLHLHPYFVTEEGLAVLHAAVAKDSKFLVSPAIKYKAVHYAETHSFSEVYAMLQNHLSDRNKRFDICVRVKRGMKDTSLPGAFPKDQVYLKGAIEVWQWLKKHDFDPSSLYIGKIALEDVDMLKPLSMVDPLHLPHFYTEAPEKYSKRMQEIGKANFF